MFGHVIDELPALNTGSGKTTLANKLVTKGFSRIGADDIRGELFGDPIIQADTSKVFEIFFARLESF
ncbi:unnamed protein product [Sphagnum balticum]